jgi:hypothetical protein
VRVALQGLSSLTVDEVSLPILILRFRGFRVLQSHFDRPPRTRMAYVLPFRPSALPGP